MPVDGILLVGVDRAGDHARRLQAVMAGGRDVLHHRRRARAADEQAHVAPRLRFVEPVERMAGGDARLAARAAVEIDLEGVLLPRPRRRRGQAARDNGEFELRLAIASPPFVMPAAELLDGRERLLLVEQLCDQRARRVGDVQLRRRCERADRSVEHRQRRSSQAAHARQRPLAGCRSQRRHRSAWHDVARLAADLRGQQLVEHFGRRQLE